MSSRGFAPLATFPGVTLTETVSTFLGFPVLTVHVPCPDTAEREPACRALCLYVTLGVGIGVADDSTADVCFYGDKRALPLAR